MCSSVLEDDERFRKIIDVAIASGEVSKYPKYSSENDAKRKRRRKAAEKEAQEADELSKELGVKGKLKSKDEDPSQNSLAALIRQRQAGRLDNLISNLEAKYGQEKSSKKKRNNMEMEVEPSEEEFLATRNKIAGGDKSKSKRGKKV